MDGRASPAVVSFPDPRSRHPFHMHSMIYGQPAFVEEAVRRVRSSDFFASLSRARHLVLTGCGTSYHAAQYGARILQAADERRVVRAIHAYDFAERSFPGTKATVVGVSHSGSTPTTNRALARAKKAGNRVAGICGLSGSRMEDLADDVLVIGSTHDRSWANTMSYTTQLASFAALAVQVQPDWTDVDRGISQLPAVLEKALNAEKAVRVLSRRFARKDRITFLGSHWDEITALEAALKIRETCGVTASGYHPEQFLHGPFLALGPDEPVVFLRSRDDGARASVLFQALSKTGAAVTEVGERSSARIRLPGVHPFLRPIVSIVPLQFLAYYAALARRSNPDIMRTDIPRLHAGVEALFH